LSDFFSKFIDLVSSGFMQFGIRDAIDIVVLAYIVYKLLKFAKGTRAMQVLKGLGVLLLATIITDYFKISGLAWLLDQVLRAGAIALVVLFQPELRRALEQIGRTTVFKKTGSADMKKAESYVSELVTAMHNLSLRKVGALILIEHQTGLADIVSTGTVIDAEASAALIENIFEPNTPLHDGAVVISNMRVRAAGCFLPLSDNNNISRQLGTRHRAALGISEVSDCMAFVVSEETGVISMASNGQLTRYLDEEQIRNFLMAEFTPHTNKFRDMVINNVKK